MFQNNKSNKTLDSYLLPESDLSIKEIHNILLQEKKIIPPKNFDVRGNMFIFIKLDSNFFYLKFKGIIYKILINPIKIKYFSNNDYLEYDLYSETQFKNLSKELEIYHPEIIYIKDNIINKANYTFSSYISLYKNATNIYIKDKMEIKILPIEKFSSFNQKNKNQINNGKFLGIIFDSPKAFDTNYYYYFPGAIKNKERFEIILSQKRSELCRDFQQNECTAIRKYFGQNSIGKSITLIGTLKYTFDHDYFATLYINCETIKTYSYKDQNICKQILIDEIRYLFYQDYETYCIAANYISNFKFVPNEKDKNFWSLILHLFSYFNRSKFYYISFDQYNCNVDPFNQMKDIWETTMKMNELNISILILNTLNDPKIKEYKTKSLLNEEFDDEYMTLYIEIEDFIEPEKLKFYNEDLDEKLEYLGRNIKNYNLLNLLNKRKINIENYIENEKIETKRKIFSFFGIEEDSAWIKSEKVYKMLSFSVNFKYSFEDFKMVYDNIPFEYFDINKKKYDNNEEYIEINYRFPMVNDIFDEIYSQIILTRNINSILFNKIFEGGAKGELFEKIVIQNFTPNEGNNYNVNFFEEFIVSKIYKVDKFVPKQNENLKKEKNNIINIESLPFLLKQEKFGGKAFDVVIVYYFGIEAIFFCFQITGHKKKSDLMEYRELQKEIDKMIEYMQNYFSFEIISVYFSYIFDFTKIEENQIINMYETLEKRNIKFIFYDLNSNNYYDKYSNQILNINKSMNEFNIKDGKKIENGQYHINNYQKSAIIKIFKTIYKSNEISFHLFHKSALNIENLIKIRLFCLTQIKLKMRMKYFCVILKKIKIKLFY